MNSTSVSCLAEIADPLVLDTSVVVNLNATGFADRILSAIPTKTFVPTPVLHELKRGIHMGYSDATDLRELLRQGLVETMNLPRHTESEYISLVSGSAASSLGDGEAATIVSARAHSAWAAIDERKARKICSEHYKELRIASTVDILAHPKVISAMTDFEFSTALLAALEVANMQVQKHHMDWVVAKIDPGRIGNCLSLPRVIREATQIRQSKSSKQLEETIAPPP